jgi:acyl-CoA synthetase (AMP-forming)/AMP-acid ligase II
VATIPDILRTRARRTPAARAFTFLQDGECESASLTFEELDARSRGVATVLRESADADAPVLVI